MKKWVTISSWCGLVLLSLINLLWAQTMTNGKLSSRQQAIIPIAAFTATGDLDKLNTALKEGLDSGLTINEIKEILVQMYAYTGFPRSLNGLGMFMEVINERKQLGIHDTLGKEASPLATHQSRIELGTEIQTTLAGAPVKGPLFDFSPEIDRFLKDHLFGDIFSRDNLNFQDREIATIAALASLGGVDSQLQSHLEIGMNVGLTEKQLNHLISVLRSTAGEAEETPPSSQDILRQGSQATSQGSDQFFTGNVTIDLLFPPTESMNAAGGKVTFEAGARSAWHTHPAGQTLIITSGKGWTQVWGGPIEELHEGDVVNCPSGVKHWHGASPDSAMSHIAIAGYKDGKNVEWLEQVSDEQYKQEGD